MMQLTQLCPDVASKSDIRIVTDNPTIMTIILEIYNPYIQ